MVDRNANVPEGHKEVFCRYIVRNGRRIYPKKAKFFRFLVKVRAQ